MTKTRTTTSPCRGGKNGEDDDDEKSDAAEDFFFDFPALQYDAYETVREEFEKSAIGKEANKFAEYERRLREWEDRERTREKHQRGQQKNTGGGSGPEGKLTPSEERRRAFFAAAAARGHFFDQEGYVVDKNGKRKKNKKGQFVRFHPGMEEQFGVKKNGNKKSQKASAAAANERKGAAKPWTASEDALLCAIVHEFGSNWALVADAFGASASLKGSYRRPELCRWRFQQLTRAVELENDPEAFAALNLDKGSARVVMSRSLPLEDETARSHFQAVAHSCSSYAKIRRAALRERVGMDPQKRIKPHQSWKDCMKMFPLKSPAELAHISEPCSNSRCNNSRCNNSRCNNNSNNNNNNNNNRCRCNSSKVYNIPRASFIPATTDAWSANGWCFHAGTTAAEHATNANAHPTATVGSCLQKRSVRSSPLSKSRLPSATTSQDGSYQPQAGKGCAMSVGGMAGSSPAPPREEMPPRLPLLLLVETPLHLLLRLRISYRLGSGEKQPARISHPRLLKVPLERKRGKEIERANCGENEGD